MGKVLERTPHEEQVWSMKELRPGMSGRCYEMAPGHDCQLMGVKGGHLRAHLAAARQELNMGALSKVLRSLHPC